LDLRRLRAGGRLRLRLSLGGLNVVLRGRLALRRLRAWGWLRLRLCCGGWNALLTLRRLRLHLLLGLRLGLRLHLLSGLRLRLRRLRLLSGLRLGLRRLRLLFGLRLWLRLGLHLLFGLRLRFRARMLRILPAFGRRVLGKNDRSLRAGWNAVRRQAPLRQGQDGNRRDGQQGTFLTRSHLQALGQNPLPAIGRHCTCSAARRKR
jgi:hypothetical protein